MIKEVTSKSDADYCDTLLTKLILDEANYDKLLDKNYVCKNHFNKLINNDNYKLLAYYQEEKILGYILVRKMDDNLCLLDGLYVSEEFRNKHIATELINEAIKVSKEFGARCIDLNVMKDNSAKDIYQKLGFNEFEIKMRMDLEK